ncbi:MAG: hypothetical protein A2137_02155 [Chloroflexi bacterium RBG_16_58_8]|nr:MAG: hypothetical protein A2137_02155 [Chloroflexi bacterium RBG_16_58_8]
MRLLFSLLLIAGGMGGALVSFLSDITVHSSTMEALDGLNLSMLLGVFSVIVLLNGIVDLFSAK